MERGDVPLNIRVVLIHHRDSDRVAAVQGTVDTVTTALSAFGHVDVTEISHQPMPRPLSLRVIVGRRLRQWHLERRWAAHLGVGRRWVLSSGLLLLRLLQLTGSEHRARASRQAYIELSLSAKHQLAWRLAAEDATDVLVVLEDDARALAETAQRLSKVLRAAGPGLRETYADLAGGLSRRQLRIGHVTHQVGDGVVELSRASTNTTCAYLIGASIVTELADRTTLDPPVGRLPADWLMNLAFMSTSVRCLHSSPSALEHGSLTGAVNSSIRA